LGHVLIERAYGDLARLGAFRPAFAHLLEKRASLHVLVPLRHDEENRRRLGRPHQLEEQRGAVGVPPLGIIDVDDERPSAGQRAEELAERRERSPAYEVRVRDLRFGDCADGRHALQNGEHAGKGADVGRQLDRFALLLQMAEVAAERVDHAIDRLVGDRFTLVGATAQHDRFAPPDQPVEKVGCDGRFAHSRGAGHADGDRTAR
jgi:hypothetical protein